MGRKKGEMGEGREKEGKWEDGKKRGSNGGKRKPTVSGIKPMTITFNISLSTLSHWEQTTNHRSRS